MLDTCNTRGNLQRNIEGSDRFSNVEDVGEDQRSLPLEELLCANNAEKAKEIVD